MVFFNYQHYGNFIRTSSGMCPNFIIDLTAVQECGYCRDCARNLGFSERATK